MQSQFDPLVHIDWKTPGSDLLGLLQHYYPDVGVFAGPGFEALLDELFNEMPEVCFEALAAVLAGQGYDLWNLDAGGDDYRPVVFPSDQREAFARHWQSARGEPRFTPILIEPPKPAAVERKPAKPKRSKLKWLQEVHDYPGATYVHEYNYRNGWAAITEQDEDQWLCFLIDYNQWPPTEQDMLEHRTDGVDGADLQLIDADAERSLWKRQVVRGDYSADDRYQYEIRRGDEVEAFGPAGVQWSEFEQPSVVVGSEIFERQRIYEPEHLTRIWRITADRSEVIFEDSDELTILPVGPGRLLFMQHNGKRCWVWDQAAKQAVVAQPMPAEAYKLRAATAYLGGDEILLFSEGARQNVEHSGYQETVLLAWRFNFVTGAKSKATLDGFGSELRQDTRLLVTQPKQVITLRTFHGQLHVSRGHGDWWVWGYRANTFGTQTLAWFWNQRSNEVVKLSTKDIPRIKPEIRYVAAQDRYLAFEADFVARLPEFGEIVAAKGSEVLVFE
ncbi:hypothetical protein [Pseudomonas brassicacearum]|uniref:Uncharacterized protein n=1 Tax=Pseudomonas brassicacearum subsp. neoaurantiaca TaxID=494916 RepID=A0A7V8RKI6_9PSED|nr:hypothetical protein [Pseudomonas brassicacearum]MBA1378213.1 hypothetical protein [Pseudomonas brassicacearum subsp. neoaurantiaca]